MTVEASGPVTFGQLDLLRTLQRETTATLPVWNLVEAFRLPPSASAEQVVDAWFELVRVHQSLRTVYRIDEPLPTQLVRAVHRHDLPVVELPEPTQAAAFAAMADRAAEPILVEEELPWRAVLGLHQGRPRYLMVVVHHIAVDEAALRLLRADLGRILRTGALSSATVQPRELAAEQRGDPARRRATLDYWTKAWAEFHEDDRGQADDADRFGAALCSTAALRAGERIAERLDISFQSVLLGVACLVLTRYKDRDRVTLGLISSNRVSPRWAPLVSSMMQLAPVTVAAAPARPVGDYLRDVFLIGSEAYGHGAYDIDELSAELTARRVTNPDPMSFDCLFNFLGPTGYSIDDDNPEVTSVRFRKARRQTGYRFSLYLFTSRSRGLSIQLAASERYLAPELVREFVAAMEAAVVRIADDQSVPVADLDLTPVRPLGAAGGG